MALTLVASPFFWYNAHMRHGQALIEYVLAMAGMVVVVAILFGLVHVAIRYSVRTENLVSGEYP